MSLSNPISIITGYNSIISYSIIKFIIQYYKHDIIIKYPLSIIYDIPFITSFLFL